MWHLGTWFGGHDGDGLTVGQFLVVFSILNDSMILRHTVMLLGLLHKQCSPLPSSRVHTEHYMVLSKLFLTPCSSFLVEFNIIGQLTDFGMASPALIFFQRVIHPSVQLNQPCIPF